MLTAFLGPEGSFTHQAAEQLVPQTSLLDPHDTLDSVLGALRGGAARYAVAAIDSAAGPIAETVAAVEEAGRRCWPSILSRSVLTCIAASWTKARSLVLWVMKKRWPSWLPISTTSACAHALLLQILLAWWRSAPSPSPDGAVGPSGLARAYGLRVAERAIEAPAQLVTRFVLLQRRPD
ncbi:MAG: hypothetical protein JKP95_02830 [Oceanicaulis sp.]|nr:hypothetical protein [Oceanicaulis sp.]